MTGTATAVHAVGDFYVPAFQVVLDDDQTLPENVLRDVVNVTYHDSVDDIDSFTLVLNNWDDEARDFKYVGSGRGSERSPFEPGRKIALHMGYEGSLDKMLVGEITRLEPEFPKSGAPTISVSGLNELHGFRREQHTWSWTDKTDSEIAGEIGANPIHRTRPGIDFPVRTPNARQEQPHEFIFMNNEHDIVFLLRRARRLGYTLAVRTDGDERFLYFGFQDQRGPGAGAREVTYEIEWGRSLLDFRPDLTTANQISEVTVRGWDRRTGRPIEGSASIDDLGLNTDQRDVARAIRGRREVVHRPVRSRAEARRVARSILQQNAEELVVGKGTTLGLPLLRSGEKVDLKNLGSRFSGRYYVTNTTHTIGDGGYVTAFTARREGPIPAAGTA